MKDTVLMESSSLRSELCTENNTSILEEVGSIEFLPGTQFLTIRQLACFYQVENSTLQQVVRRHRQELIQDGFQVISKKDLQTKYKLKEKIPNRGLSVFTKRAALRIGMVLRDSPVAVAVRSYLLQLAEKNTTAVANVPSNAVQEINEQLDLYALKLLEHEHKIREHSRHVTRQDELWANQNRMTTILVDEMYRNRNRLEDVQYELVAERERIDYLEEHLPVTKEIEYITQEEANFLKDKVKVMKNPMLVWAKFKVHFNIKRYIFLPRHQFQDAVQWLNNFQE